MYQRQDPRRYPQTRTAALPTASLLGQVLGITAAGFVFTAIGAYFAPALPHAVFSLAWIVEFGLIFGVYGTRGNPGLSLTLFYAFTFLMGVSIAPAIFHYAVADGAAVVVNAAATTAVGMAVLGAVVYATSIDFSRLSGIAMISLIVLVIASILSAFIHFLHPTTIAWCTLIVFTLIVLVDFARIKAGGYGSTAIEMALSIYLDAINIFMALLQIFGLGGRSRND